MNDETHVSKGLFDSLKALAISLVSIVHIRLALLSTDLEENRERLVSLLVLMLIALFCLGVGTVLLTILIVVAFWDGYRLQVLAGLAGVFLTGGMLAWGIALYKIKTRPRLFAASLAELTNDKQQMTSRS